MIICGSSAGDPRVEEGYYNTSKFQGTIKVKDRNTYYMLIR